MTATAPPRPAAGLPGLLDELRWRGMVHATTPGLEARLATGRPISAYNGFDPSGPSLHVGHLIPVFGLLHLQRRGGRPVVVIGGATGMIGDPSGTSAERNLLDRATIEANAAAITRQLERFVDLGGPSGALVVDNLDWLGRLSMLEFLRDVGKHFTIPYMLEKESVQLRLERGLSYTEFSYMLLQAYDFLHLYRTYGVELQTGGADQWGNITAGLELIRRVEGAGEESELAHGLAYPLLTDPSGAKFGKTASGTSVWLDPERTSPFAFYQFWVNQEDAAVGRLLRLFTLLEPEEILALEAEQARRPEERPAQRALALDVTRRVHGPEVAARVVRASEILFGADPTAAEPETLETLAREVPTAPWPAGDGAVGVLDLAVAAGLARSRSEARRLVEQGGLTVNGRPVRDPEERIGPDALLAGRYLLLRRGKREHRIVVRG